MKLPEFWEAGGGPVPYVYGFGYWSSGPESLPGDGLLTYHNLEGKSEYEREKDLVKLYPNRALALADWITKTIIYFPKNVRKNIRRLE